MCVECQAEQVGGIFGGAVRLGAFLVLYVLQAKGRPVGVTGGGPDHMGGPVCLAQNWLQLPNLDHNTTQG